MPFPQTWDEMIAAGYVWDNDSVCKGCGDPIMWFKTPNGKPIPMNPMQRGSDAAVAHFSTCTEADSFRKPK
jgi:hypothetical protein